MNFPFSEAEISEDRKLFSPRLTRRVRGVVNNPSVVIETSLGDFPMTQMLLFEPTTSYKSGDRVVPAVPTGGAADWRAAQQPSAQQPSTERQESGRSGAESDSAEPGLNRMGDLARLVLLRYDLVAARRARYAAK